MIKYIGKRLLQSLLTLFIIVNVVFFLMRLMPEEGYFGEQYDKMDEQQAVYCEGGCQRHSNRP